MEQSTLKLLKDNKDLVIRLADKGGSVVLLNAGLHSCLNKQILSDQVTYSRLQPDPTDTFKRDLAIVLEEGFRLGVFSKKE